jgi:hypothetical protein
MPSPVTDVRHEANFAVLDGLGEVLSCMKRFASGCHDRDQLMAMAFTGIGGLPRANIQKIQQAEARKVC